MIRVNMVIKAETFKGYDSIKTELEIFKKEDFFETEAFLNCLEKEVLANVTNTEIYHVEYFEVDVYLDKGIIYSVDVYKTEESKLQEKIHDIILTKNQTVEKVEKELLLIA